MSWTDPLWLLALILIIPLARLGWPQQRHRETQPIWRSQHEPGAGNSGMLRRLLHLRLLAAAMAVMALAGTIVFLPSRREHVVIMIDVSASIGRLQVEQARKAACRTLQRMPAGNEAAVICFAGQPRVVTPLVPRDEAYGILENAALEAPQAEATDLHAAMMLGTKLLGSHGNRSYLLFTDGHPTSGGDVVTEPFRFPPIPIHVVPVGRPAGGLATLALELPEHLRPGAAANVVWRVTSDRARKVIASLSLDGTVTSEQEVQLQAGGNEIPLSFIPPQPGQHRLLLKVSDREGRVLPEATSGGVLKVEGTARVLVVHGPGRSSPISRALAIQGLSAVDAAATGLPEEESGLSPYLAVVLDNVPATAMVASQRQALRSYVAGGGGLLVVGGENSLGRGEYYATELEEVLPVKTDTRQRLRFTKASLLFIIDHSSSMAEEVGGYDKQTVAMQGLAASLKELNPQDEVAILTFADDFKWVLPFTPAWQQAKIKASIGQIPRGGGTVLSAVLAEAARGFSGRGMTRRHVVLLTDGLGDRADYTGLCKKLRGLGVTITTIAIGEEVNENLLRSIARMGEGEYYRANLDQVPRFMVKETVRITRDLVQEGLFPLRNQGRDELTEGLMQAPPLKGYLVTKAKSLATVYLRVGKDDPLLAGWYYGAGRVLVFTSDAGQRWLQPWSGSVYYNRLWGQAVRYIASSADDPGLLVKVKADAGMAQVSVDALDSERRLRPGLQLTGWGTGAEDQPFILTETAPGHYEASLPLTGGGLQEFTIYDQHGDNKNVGWVWNQAAGEWQTLGPDLSYLGLLSAKTGGRVFSLQEIQLPKARWSWEPLGLRPLLALAALLLFLLELAYRSTSLGQINMARAALSVWWAAQMRLINLARGWKAVDGRAVQQQSMEAYRYLAERARSRKGEG